MIEWMYAGWRDNIYVYKWLIDLLNYTVIHGLYKNMMNSNQRQTNILKKLNKS